jgi:cytochrome c556
MSEKRGINDLILGKMKKIQNKSMNKIVEITKGQAPFAAEKVSNDEKLDIVNSLSDKDMLTLLQEFGEEAVNQLIYEAKSYERKKQAKLGGYYAGTVE